MYKLLFLFRVDISEIKSGQYLEDNRAPLIRNPSLLTPMDKGTRLKSRAITRVQSYTSGKSNLSQIV